MLKRFWGYFSNYKRPLIISCICVILESIFELVIPLLMADIIDVGVPARDTSYILIRGAEMVVCALIALALGAAYAHFGSIAGMGFGAELRRAEYKKVQEYSFSNIDHFSTSSLVTRLTNDVTVLQNAICNGIRPVVRGPFMMVAAFIMTVILNPKLSLIFLAAIPILGLFLYFILRKLGPMYGQMQKALDKVNRTIQENLIAIRVVKSFVTEDYERGKFAEVNSRFRKTSEGAFHYAALNMPCFQLVMYSTIICILWFGGNMVISSSMQVGELTGFLSYVLQILNSLMMISNVFMMLTRSVTSCERILEVLDEPIDIKDASVSCDPDGTVKDLQPGLEVSRGDITFENVWFKYDKDAPEYVLSDISLNLGAGQTMGILGATGSAKTSLVQLIPRLYEATKGHVLIDGHDVKEYSLVHLRDAIGVVLQKNTLFSGSIRENLLWGNSSASDEELMWACRIACADEFISRLPQGLDTVLDQGGVNVSGGQKQRLCIARALLKKPRVLIFDDSTSAVDTATESRIRHALAHDLPHTTKIIISQRISSVQHADQILIMDNGHINETGTHQQLLDHNEIYQNMYWSQKKGAKA